MAGRSATLTIKVLADTAQAAGGLNAFGRNIDTGLVAKAAVAAAAVVGITVAIVDMTKAAAADATESERLATAMDAAGAATGNWEAVVNSAIERGQELAFTDTEIRDALVPLVGATGDAAKASELLAGAQDIARLAGVDLETAAKAVAKAQAGSATSLAKLTQVNAKGLTATEVLTAAQRKAAGQAEVYGNTATGQAEAMSIGFDELGETIGSSFLPVLQEILPELKPLLKALGELIKALLPVLIPLLKALAVVIVGVAKSITNLVRDIKNMVEWIGNAIDAVGDFLGSAGDFFTIGGGIKGRSVAVPAPPTMRGVAVAPTVATSRAGAGTRAGTGPVIPTRMSATVTHRVDDPGGALAGIPGGAQAVAAWLNRGADATGLYRNLQHAAGIR